MTSYTATWLKRTFSILQCSYIKANTKHSLDSKKSNIEHTDKDRKCQHLKLHNSSHINLKYLNIHNHTLCIIWTTTTHTHTTIQEITTGLNITPSPKTLHLYTMCTKGCGWVGWGKEVRRLQIKKKEKVKCTSIAKTISSWD